MFRKVTFILLSLMLTTGCGPLEFVASDLGGWDLSACAASIDSLSVCVELVTDNLDKVTVGVP